MTFFCSSLDFGLEDWTSADVLTFFFALHLTLGGKRTASNCGSLSSKCMSTLLVFYLESAVKLRKKFLSDFENFFAREFSNKSKFFVLHLNLSSGILSRT